MTMTPRPKNKFVKPTVSEVFQLMNQAAENYQLDKWEDVSQLMDFSERTFRRWKKNVETQPETVSSIGYQGYVLLKTLAEKKAYVAPVCSVKVPAKLIMNAKKFNEQGISKDDIKTLIGLKSLSGLSVKVVAPLVGLAPNVLHNQINNYKDDKISFATWAIILMLCGVSPDKLFKL